MCGDSFCDCINKEVEYVVVDQFVKPWVLSHNSHAQGMAFIEVSAPINDWSTYVDC